jgi:hypothetical protein
MLVLFIRIVFREVYDAGFDEKVDSMKNHGRQNFCCRLWAMQDRLRRTERTHKLLLKLSTFEQSNQAANLTSRSTPPNIGPKNQPKNTAQSRKRLLFVGITLDDGLLLCAQRRLRRLQVLADGKAELSGELFKFRFGFGGERTTTKVSNSIAQLFNSRFARGGHRNIRRGCYRIGYRSFYPLDAVCNPNDQPE